MPTRLVRPSVWALVGSSLALTIPSHPGWSQEATTATNRVFDPDVVRLEDFIVMPEKNPGYVVPNSNSGTRLNMNVKEIPIPVEIISESFMKDIGALSVKEALQFTAGLETNITSFQAGENPNAARETGYRLRGFVSNRALRNGFVRIGTTDTFNIGQIDVVRGPNALLYGIGNFGGVVNYVTKNPLHDTGYTLTLTYGSDDFRRLQGDATGPVIKDKLYYRVPFFVGRNHSWYEHGTSEKYGVAPIFEYKPWKKTRLSAEIEYMYRKNAQGEDPMASTLVGSSSQSYIDPTFYPDTIIGGPRDGQPTDRGFLYRPDREFRWVGPDTYEERVDRGLLLTLTQEVVEGLILNVGYYHSRQDTDALRVSDFRLSSLGGIQSESPDAQRLRRTYPWAYNPLDPLYSAWSEPGGAALSYSWDKEDTIDYRDQARAELAYSLEVFNTVNRFLLGTTYSKRWTEEGDFALKDTSRAPQPLTATDISGLQGAYTRFKSIFDYTPIRYQLGPTEEFVEIAPSLEKTIFWENGYYLVHHGIFWKRRINTISGLRYDRYHTANSARNGLTDPGPLGQLKNITHSTNITNEWNFSFGASLAINDRFSVFGLTAAALDPEIVGSQRLATGEVAPPVSGQSLEVGLKFDLFEGKISGTMAVYQIEREGNVIEGTGSKSYPFDNDDPTSPSYDPDWQAQGRGDSGTKSLRDDRSQGVDLQIYLIKFVPNLETIVNFSYNKYKIQRVTNVNFVEKIGTGPNAQYVFEYIDAKAQALRDSGNPDFEAWNEDRLNNDMPPYSFKLWNKYTFTEGFLDGFDVGLGLEWSDEREATYGFLDSNFETSYKVIPAHWTGSAALGYRRDFAKFGASLRLNVQNLWDDDEVYGYGYPTPRSYRLTLTLDF